MFARYGDVFRAWLPADVRVVCRYHGREHGWAAAEFHARCNNCGPMLVVVLSAAGAGFWGLHVRGLFDESWRLGVHSR